MTAATAELAAAAKAYDARAARMEATGGPARRRARSETTREKYMADLLLYLDFCQQTDRIARPGTGVTMLVFTEALFLRPVTAGKNRGRIGWAPASIRRAWSAIRTWHDLMGDSPPSLTLASDRLEEYAAGRAEDPTSSDGEGAPALRLPTLDAMFQALPTDTAAGVRDRALLSLGWSMMAPRGVLADLDIDHIVKVEVGLQVTVFRDLVSGRPLAEPRTVEIPWMPSLGSMCPVTCTLAWKSLLGVLGIVSGPLLRSVDKHDNVTGTDRHAGPPGTGYRMDPATVDWVVNRAAVNAALANAGDLTSQSLRRGGIEDAAAAGADSLTISRHAGYSDRSTQVFRWIGDSVRGGAFDGVTYQEVQLPTVETSTS